MTSNAKVRINAFRASSDVESSIKFADGHRRVLEAHGVKKVTSSNLEWTEDPSVFVLLVESLETGRALGGARVHASTGNNILPIESATVDLDPRVVDVIKRESLQGTGELCGLWNSMEVAGLGIGSFFATRAGVVICEQLGISSLFALCAPYTVRWAQRVGCQILEGLGNNGTFYYPKEDLLATAVLLPDTKVLETAKPGEQDKINYLRENLQCVMSENPPGKRFEVDIEYDLSIQDANPNEFKINGAD